MLIALGRYLAENRLFGNCGNKSDLTITAIYISLPPKNFPYAKLTLNKHWASGQRLLGYHNSSLTTIHRHWLAVIVWTGLMNDWRLIYGLAMRQAVCRKWLGKAKSMRGCLMGLRRAVTKNFGQRIYWLKSQGYPNFIRLWRHLAWQAQSNRG